MAAEHPRPRRLALWSGAPLWDAPAVDALARSIAAAGPPDALALLGGFAPPGQLDPTLARLAGALAVPVHFVLAPADHAGGALATVRAQTAARVRTTPGLGWPGMGTVAPLGPGRALVGHGGWGDTREGRWDAPQDGLLETIHELRHRSPEALRHRLLRLGTDAALVLRAALAQAAVRHWAVEVLLHTAPFVALRPRATPTALAAGVCGAVGRVLTEAAAQFPGVQFRAWCTGPEAVTHQPADNLVVHALPPGLHPLELPPLAPRTAPGDAGNPVPLVPAEEAATIVIPRARLPGRDREADDPLQPHRPEPDALVALLYELAARPPQSPYPLPAGTSPGAWRADLEDAIELLDTRGLLYEEDEAGVGLSDWLGALALGPLAPSLGESVGRRRLVGELVLNLAHPGRINQGHKGTCAVTCVEVWLAEQRPAELCRVIAGLARPEGQVLLYNGETMLRDEDRLVWGEREARRSPVSRLFQVAAMEYAYPGADYRNDEDAHFEVNTAGVELNAGTGLGLSAFDRLLEGVTGHTWRTLSEHESAMADAFARLGVDTSFLPRIDRDALGIMRRCLAAGAGCFVTLEPGEARDTAATRRAGESWRLLPHKVRLLRIDDATDRIWYEDPFDPEHPWIPGVDTRVEDPFGTCSMDRADFLRLMVELSFPPRFAPKAPA